MRPSGEWLALPVDPTRYPLFFRTPRWQVWRSIVGFIAMLIGSLLLMSMIPLVAVIIDLSTGRLTMDDLASLTLDNMTIMTPTFFLFNNLAIAACIPLALVLAWLIFKQRPGWMHAVTGRFRWKWALLLFASFAPFWIIGVVIDALLQRSAGTLDVAWNADSLFLIGAVLLTTPLQCAGEEYLCRGMLNRSAASLWKHRIGGSMIGAIASSIVFMALHVSTDVWLNTFYFSFGAAACWITWRTGGLEGAVAMHAINNLAAMWLLPFSDFKDLFSREAGAGSPISTLISLTMIALAIGVTEFWMRRKSVVVESAPGLVALPPPPVYWAPPASIS